MKVDIRSSTKKDKKLMAIFYDDTNKKVKTIHFGAAGMSDYTIHKDKKRKQRYMIRHKKRENWEDPMTAGSLSRYVLWNKPTLRGSISDYRKRFQLKPYRSKKTNKK